MHNIHVLDRKRKEIRKGYLGSNEIGGTQKEHLQNVPVPHQKSEDVHIWIRTPSKHKWVSLWAKTMEQRKRMDEYPVGKGIR